MALSAKAQKTARRYLGSDALGYEAKRAGQAKWLGEDRAVKAALVDLPKGAKVLDCPCGTGRFFGFAAERGLEMLGVDVSPDMIKIAVAKPDATAQVGSIFDLPFDAGRFDAALAIRFMNLIEPEDVRLALAELQRVARKVIFTLRVRQRNPSGHYHSAHPVSLVERSLAPGWSIGANEPVHQEDYRLVTLCAGST
jgi:SAM-dependent methyltransferase